MDRNELQRLAIKYFNGTATPEEKASLHQWYDVARNGEETEIVETPDTEAVIKQRIFDSIIERMSSDREAALPKAGKINILKQMALRYAAAAAVLVITLGGFWYYYKAGKKSDIGAQMMSVTAPQVMKINLPDGSSVWLGAHSIFKYPSNFNGKVRIVELVEGRAFFDVEHRDDQPFLVKTKSLNITVLGTSFDVRTYGKDGTTKVSVVSGKVGITRPGHANEPAVFLLPKQQVVANKQKNILKKEVVTDQVVDLWRKDPLVFDQESLDNVFRAIEKQYNTHIETANKKLLNEHISITLGNQRLDTIMEILSFTKNFKYQIANDSTVVIK